MNVTVINLASRKDRRREMEKQLSNVGWAAKFFEAVRPETENGFPSIGARGCFESHLAVLKSAQGSDLILLEDDLDFVRNFQPQWQSAVASLPDDWSIFYPAHSFKQSGLIPSASPILCTHMVVFRASVIPRMIAALETIMSRPAGHPLGGPMHVDGAYNTIRSQNPDIKTYGLSHPLGFQRSSKSDISGPSWIDSYPRLAAFVRPIKSLLRSRFGTPLIGFRSFLALPFLCVGVLFLGIGMVFLGIGGAIDAREEEGDVVAGPRTMRQWPFDRQ